MIINGTTMNIDDLTIDGTSIKILKSRLEAISADNAAAHNSVYRGKNLGTSITDAQLSAIRNGSFDDLYIGDYWKLPVDGETTAQIVGCSINQGNMSATADGIRYELPWNNLCVWFRNQNWKFPINDTDTCAGHLKGSKLYNETFPAIAAMLEAVLPSGSLRESTCNLADSINANGVPNHYIREKMKLYLPSLQNFGVKGYVVDQNSAYATVSNITWPYSNFMRQNLYSIFWLDQNFSATHWQIKYHWQWSGCEYPSSSTDVNCWPYCYIG